MLAGPFATRAVLTHNANVREAATGARVHAKKGWRVVADPALRFARLSAAGGADGAPAPRAACEHGRGNRRQDPRRTILARSRERVRDDPPSRHPADAEISSTVSERSTAELRDTRNIPPSIRKRLSVPSGNVTVTSPAFIVEMKGAWLARTPKYPTSPGATIDATSSSRTRRLGLRILKRYVESTVQPVPYACAFACSTASSIVPTM